MPGDCISFARDTYEFRSADRPSDLLETFRQYYGPTMNAFDAAERAGRADDLQRELLTLFESQNTSKAATSISATYLRVTVTVP